MSLCSCLDLKGSVTLTGAAACSVSAVVSGCAVVQVVVQHLISRAILLLMGVLAWLHVWLPVVLQLLLLYLAGHSDADGATQLLQLLQRCCVQAVACTGCNK